MLHCMVMCWINRHPFCSRTSSTTLSFHCCWITYLFSKSQKNHHFLQGSFQICLHILHLFCSVTPNSAQESSFTWGYHFWIVVLLGLVIWERVSLHLQVGLELIIYPRLVLYSQQSLCLGLSSWDQVWESPCLAILFSTKLINCSNWLCLRNLVQ